MKKKICDPFDVAVGAILKETRLSKNYSLMDVCTRIKVQKGTYFYYETGEVSLSMSRFIKICEVLGLNYLEVMERARKEAHK